MKRKALTTTFGLISGSLLAFLAFGSCAVYASHEGLNVVINGVALEPAKVQLLQALGLRPSGGRYWYDRASGLWGKEGGPAMGQTLPGLEVGGPLRADASGGNTGVFINGRELHPAEVMYLKQCTPVRPGRYWMVANGIVGPEGGPPQANLVALCGRAQAKGGGQTWRSKTTGIGVSSQGNFIGIIGRGVGGRSWSVTVGD
ncbi:MAG: hypothetical protein ACE5JS_09370 [Nitrospinota bacterium]